MRTGWRASAKSSEFGLSSHNFQCVLGFLFRPGLSNAECLMHLGSRIRAVYLFRDPVDFRKSIDRLSAPASEWGNKLTTEARISS